MNRARRGKRGKKGGRKGARKKALETLILLGEEKWERGSGGVESTGVSQGVRVTGRDES